MCIRDSIITFYTSYFLLAVTIIILWVLLPTVVLIAFLIVASFHFGKEDTQFLINNNSYLNQFLFFFKGSLVILAPLYFNFNETVSIFKLLLIENESFYQSLNVIENNNFLIFIVTNKLSQHRFIKF